MVFDKLLYFYFSHQLFGGESIVQSDVGYIEGPQLLAEIADDLFAGRVEIKC